MSVPAGQDKSDANIKTKDASLERLGKHQEAKSLVVVLDPFRVAILQHVGDPHTLHGGVAGSTLFPKLKTIWLGLSAVPGVGPAAVGLLGVEGTLDPAALDQVLLTGYQEEGNTLQIQICHPKVNRRF